MLTLINGAAVGLSLPGRLAFVSEVVPEEDFVRAYGLYYVALNCMRIGGPAIGGVVIATVGAEGAYGIIAVAQMVALVFLLFVKGRLGVLAKPVTSFMQDVRSLFALMFNSSTILVLMGAQLGITFFVFSVVSLMPVFAVTVFHVDATGQGALQAASGLGGLIGSLFVAALGRTERKALLLLISGGVQALVLIGFCAVSQFELGLFFIGGVGFSQAVYTTLNSTLFQTSAPPDMRGRAMSLYLLGGALQPLAVVPVSMSADHFGVQPTGIVSAFLLIVYIVLVGLLFPRFRTMRS